MSTHLSFSSVMVGGLVSLDEKVQGDVYTIFLASDQRTTKVRDGYQADGTNNSDYGNDLRDKKKAGTIDQQMFLQLMRPITYHNLPDQTQKIFRLGHHLVGLIGDTAPLAALQRVADSGVIPPSNHALRDEIIRCIGAHHVRVQILVGSHMEGNNNQLQFRELGVTPSPILNHYPACVWGNPQQFKVCGLSDPMAEDTLRRALPLPNQHLWSLFNIENLKEKLDSFFRTVFQVQQQPNQQNGAFTSPNWKGYLLYGGINAEVVEIEGNGRAR